MNSKHLLWLLLLIPAIAIMGCEGETGPAGPAGADGADGADGANGMSPAACFDCHNDVDDLQIQLEYAMSGHKAGEFVDYAGGRGSCSRCHSKQGFQRFSVGAEAEDIVDPAAIDCSTCHVVHPDPLAFSLRLGGASVEALFDDTYFFDFQDQSNLCANCHQSRRAEPNTAAPADTFAITSTHYGPHHGPQANVLDGVGFAEIAGSVAYPAPGGPPGSHLGVGMTCFECHMDNYDAEAGGHTWKPMVSTCTGCHAGADSFDINGFQTDTQAKLDELRDMLIDLGVVEGDEEHGYHPVVGTYPMIEAQAFFNWIGLEEDRSLGAHNPSYVDALLDNTIEALTPED